jgi:hypothetical protein
VTLPQCYVPLQPAWPVDPLPAYGGPARVDRSSVGVPAVLCSQVERQLAGQLAGGTSARRWNVTWQSQCCTLFLQVCLQYVASNLSQVITTQEYRRLTESCAGMVNEILAAVAQQGSAAVGRASAVRPAVAAAPAPRRIARRREDEA